MLRVLPSTLKPVLQQITEPVASYVNPKFWLDKITLKSRHTRELHLGTVKCEISTDLVAKSKTTVYLLQQLFATCKNLICWKTGLIGGLYCKTRNIAIQLLKKQGLRHRNLHGKRSTIPCNHEDFLHLRNIEVTEAVFSKFLSFTACIITSCGIAER